MDGGGKQCTNEICAEQRCCYLGLIANQSEQLTVAQLQELLRERYGSAMQKEKFQAELRARRRKTNEDLSTLRADISRLVSLAFPGDVSTMSQKMVIDYFLDALNDPDFALKIRESEPKNLNEAYILVLRLEMIRKKGR